jgi:hypothetical protein
MTTQGAPSRELQAIGEIALRGHVVRRKQRRKRRRSGQSPGLSLLLTTVPVAVAGEPLWFGAYALVAEDSQCAPTMRPRLFYRDNLPATDIAELTAYAARRGWSRPIPQSAFLRVLYRHAYKQRLPVVSFSVAEHLCRLAAGWEAGSGDDADAFSLILWTRPAAKGRSKSERRRRKLLRNGEIENGFRPRIVVKAIDGRRAFIRFLRRWKPDPEDLIPEGGNGRPNPHYVWPGRFTSLQQLCGGLTGEIPRTLPALLAAFGFPATPEPPRCAGLLARADRGAWELECLAIAYPALIAEHRRHVDERQLGPDRVISPATYADALLGISGLSLPKHGGSRFAKLNGITMGGFFGGETLTLSRRLQEDAAVTTLDSTNHYPVAQHLLGVFELLHARRLRIVERDPEELRTFIDAITPDRLLDPATWREIGVTFVHIVPDGDILPHKRRHDASSAWQLRVAPLTHANPLPFHLADAIVSRLETGRTPRIVSGFSLVGDGVQPGLRPFTLASGRVVDPITDDVFLALAEECLRVERRLDLPAHERKRLHRFYKLVANSACSGLFAQVNPSPDNTSTRVVWQFDGTRRDHVTAGGEEPGRWYFPPFAAAVPAAGRLRLHLDKILFEQEGCEVAYMDTDSLAVPTLVPGGLDPARIEAVCERLDALNPFPRDLNPYTDTLVQGPAGEPVLARVRRPILLQAEDENYDGGPAWPHQAHLYAISSKNYDIYTTHQAGPHVEIHNGHPVVIQPRLDVLDLTVVKASEHSLGHLLDPRTNDPDTGSPDWIRTTRERYLKLDLGLPTEPPPWLDEPSLSVIRLTHPVELRQLGKLSRRLRGALRPWSRITIALPLSRTRRADGTRLTPAAPWHDGFDPLTAKWFDLTTGEPIHIHIAAGDIPESSLSPGGRMPVQTIRTTIAGNLRRPESKAVTPNGEPCSPETRGPLVPAPTDAHKIILIGRETNNLDRVGITEDPSYTTLSDPDQTAWKTLIRPTLCDLAPRTDGGVAAVALHAGVARSTLERAIKTGQTNGRAQRSLTPVAGSLATDALRHLRPGSAVPDDPEHACHLYLRYSGQLAPALCHSCSTPLTGRQRKWCAECRAHSRRRDRAARNNESA